MSSYPENDKTVVINGDYVLSVRGFLKIIESVSKTDIKYGPEC